MKQPGSTNVSGIFRHQFFIVTEGKIDEPKVPIFFLTWLKMHLMCMFSDEHVAGEQTNVGAYPFCIHTSTFHIKSLVSLRAKSERLITLTRVNYAKFNWIRKLTLSSFIQISNQKTDKTWGLESIETIRQSIFALWFITHLNQHIRQVLTNIDLFRLVMFYAINQYSWSTRTNWKGILLIEPTSTKQKSLKYSLCFN